LAVIGIKPPGGETFRRTVSDYLLFVVVRDYNGIVCNRVGEMPVSERVDAALPFSGLSAAFQAFVYTHYNFIEHARKW